MNLGIEDNKFSKVINLLYGVHAFIFRRFRSDRCMTSLISVWELHRMDKLTKILFLVCQVQMIHRSFLSLKCSFVTDFYSFS